MRQIFLTIFTLVFLTNVFGQKTELSGAFNSGLFSFSGRSTVSTTFINYDAVSKTGYTNNPYGSKDAFCYGISLNIKRVSKLDIIFGFDFGYETLRNKVSIDRIIGTTLIDLYEIGATGQTIINSNFLNFNPYIGYRVDFKKIYFDLSGGIDIGYCLKSTEHGNATDKNGLKYSTVIDRKTIDYDIRPRIQCSIYYDKFGIFIGYSYGLTNYLNKMTGDEVYESYSRLLRFGLIYRII